MDFAELDVLQEQRINFLVPFKASVTNAEEEFRVVLITAGCEAERTCPNGFFTDNSGQRRNMMDRLIRTGFDRFMSKTNRTIGLLAEAFQTKVQTLTLAVQDRDIQINNLTVELAQLKELIAQDNQKIQSTLNNYPQVQQALTTYQNNPRVPLSTDQETIMRLSWEIKKLTGELHLAKANNLNLQNQNKLLQKQYNDKVLLESEIIEIKLGRSHLQFEREKLQSKITELEVELSLQKDLVKQSSLNLSWFNPLNWFDFTGLKRTIYEFLGWGFLGLSALSSLRISVKLFLFLTSLLVGLLGLKYWGYF
jgi:hypothetical protein